MLAPGRRWSQCQRTVRPSNSWISNDKGPVARVMVLGSQSPLDGRSHAYTGSPIEKARGFECRSWLRFWCSCCERTWFARSGRTRLKIERGHQPRSSSAGVIPVVECGVRRWLRRNLDSRSSSVPSGVFFRKDLKVCTARSAKPFAAG